MKQSRNRIIDVLAREQGFNPRTLKYRQKKQSYILHSSLRDENFEASEIGKKLGKLVSLSGQRPKVTFAKQGVAVLGIRKGAVSGAYVTIRGKWGKIGGTTLSFRERKLEVSA